MRYIITAGGTGGHIKPAMALADSLVLDNHEVIFIASTRDIDKYLLKDVDTYQVYHLYMDGLSRQISPSGIKRNFKNVFAYLKVDKEVKGIFDKFNPDHVIGFGGFITYPVVSRAIKKGVATSIHEQNSYPGLVNRKLALKVDRVFYTYENSKTYFSGAKKLIYSSNPSAASVDDSVTNDRDILFVGGSLGALAINNLACELAKETDYNITLICGQRYIDEVDVKYDNLKMIAFAENLGELIAKSKIVVTRGGASTLIELMYAKTLTLVIPSPNVVENHQETNASELKALKMLDYINEADLSTNNVLAMLNELIAHQDDYYKAMDSYAKISAIDVIKKEILNG